MKFCRQCEQNKKLSDFPKYRYGKDGLRSYCKKCHSSNTMEYNKAHPEKRKIASKRHYQKNKDDIKLKNKIYSKANPDKRKDSKLKHLYGMTLTQYVDMFQSQNGRCAICQIEAKVDLCVDHDHKTGKVRGLLCRRCNSGLGLFNDSSEILDKASSYLTISS